MNFESGAFGDPTATETLHLFWTKMEALHYPEAGHTKKYFAEKLERERAMQAQQMQMQQMQMQIQQAQAQAQAQAAQQARAQQEAEQAVIRQAQHDAAAAAGMNQVPGAPAGAQGMTL